MGEKSFQDMELDASMLEGARRCVNHRKTGTAVLPPTVPFEGSEAELMDRQRATYPPKQLDIYQVELLKRAKSLLQFWDSNVGGTQDFPLIMMGDSEEAITLLNRQLGELRAITGVLSEV